MLKESYCRKEKADEDLKREERKTKNQLGKSIGISVSLKSNKYKVKHL